MKNQMKNVILYCHPNPQSFCHAILETVVQELTAKGQEVEVRDLYAMNFQAVKQPADFVDLQNHTVATDIKTEQDHLRSADRIIVIYPLWWAGLPGLLKGYIDRVFSVGFAYSYDFSDLESFKLAGKEVYLFTTMGAPNLFYRLTLMLIAMGKTCDGGIFRFCKMKVKSHSWFGSVASTSDQKRARYLARAKSITQGMR